MSFGRSTSDDRRWGGSVLSSRWEGLMRWMLVVSLVVGEGSHQVCRLGTLEIAVNRRSTTVRLWAPSAAHTPSWGCWGVGVHEHRLTVHRTRCDAATATANTNTTAHNKWQPRVGTETGGVFKTPWGQRWWDMHQTFQATAAHAVSESGFRATWWARMVIVVTCLSPRWGYVFLLRESGGWKAAHSRA